MTDKRLFCSVHFADGKLIRQKSKGFMTYSLYCSEHLLTNPRA